MNKLEQFKAEQVLSYTMSQDGNLNDYSDGYEEGWNKGFDSCIDLELPVKFADYLSKNWRKSKGKWFHVGDFYKNEKKNPTTKEIFNHWLQNIWKYEH